MGERHCHCDPGARLTMPKPKKRKLERANTLRWNDAPAVKGSAYNLLKTPGQRPLRVGSHCSGWASEGLSLEALDLPHQHIFACDNDHGVEVLLKKCFDIGTFFREMSHPDSIALAPVVDVYVNGWPCQPQSNMGNGLGSEDSRSQVVDHLVKYLAQKLPRCFVLENVAAILHKRHLDWFEAILAALRTIQDPSTGEAAYEVLWETCKSEDAGLAQRRSRVYVVGAMKKWYGTTRGNPDFQWPPAEAPRPLEDFLDRAPDGSLMRGDGSISDPSLLRGTEMRNLLRMETQFEELGKDPAQYHIIVDVAASPSRAQLAVGMCPTITKHRGGLRGFYITSLNRRLSVSEMIRLQGASPERFMAALDDIGHKAMGEICGNAMSPPVLTRILQSLLPSVGLTSALPQ